jgi:hypothetical protein
VAERPDRQVVVEEVRDDPAHVRDRHGCTRRPPPGMTTRRSSGSTREGEIGSTAGRLLDVGVRVGLEVVDYRCAWAAGGTAAATSTA